MVVRATRPDIAHAVGRLAERVKFWTTEDQERLEIVVSYLKQYPALGINIKSNHDTTETLRYITYSDSDFATNSDRRSYTGGAVMIQGSSGSSALVGWLSKKQSIVSLSTAEAEIIAAIMTIRRFDEIMDASDALDLGSEKRIMIDNEAAITALPRGYSGKLNYVNKTRDVYIRWCPTYFDRSQPKLMKTHTSLNISDMFTKLLPRQRLSELPVISGSIFRE